MYDLKQSLKNPAPDFLDAGFAKSSSHYSPFSGLNVAENGYFLAMKIITQLFGMMRDFIKQEAVKVKGIDAHSDYLVNSCFMAHRSRDTRQKVSLWRKGNTSS